MEGSEQTKREGPVGSVSDLVIGALSTNDDSEPWKRWDYVRSLKYEGSREALERMRELSVSSCAHERALAADVLAELGMPERTFPAEAGAILVRMLETEKSDSVLESICYALGHQQAQWSTDLLIGHSSHPNCGVRHAVVMGLNANMNWKAADALLKLMRDLDEDVRDWATFAIGIRPEFDSAEIREAFYRALDDESLGVAFEAMNGLAERKDPRVLAILREGLMVDDVAVEIIDHAATFGSPELVPSLERLVARSDVDETRRKSVEWALKKCRGEIAGA